MNIKKIILDGESEKGKENYTKMLKWFDNPKRQKCNNLCAFYISFRERMM